MIRKFDSFVAEGMHYKPVDRTKVSTRDIILDDGQAYDVYVDPFTVAADKMWADMQAYELRGDKPQNMQALKARVQPL